MTKNLSTRLPFSMRFTEDERRVLEMAAAGRPLAAYIRRITMILKGNQRAGWVTDGKAPAQ
jgi:hypothetical protein